MPTSMYERWFFFVCVRGSFCECARAKINSSMNIKKSYNPFGKHLIGKF